MEAHHGRPVMPHCLLLLLAAMEALMAMAMALHLPLPPPIQCSSSSSSAEVGGCVVHNFQALWHDRKPCHASAAFYPTTEAQLFDAVALAARTATPVKVVSKGSNSLPKLVCPAGDRGILISTERYNSILHLNLSALTVTAQAGVLLTHLLPTLAAHGLSLPHTPYWRGVSVAGMISTGSHGSSLWHPGSTPHDYVVAIRLIVPHDGHARIIDLADGDHDLDAARLSLGLLGAISTVTFQLQPLFKRSVSLQLHGDEQLETEILDFAARHEFAAVSWYPASRKVHWRIDDRVGIETDGDGRNNLPLLDGLDVQQIESFRTTEESFQETHDSDLLCQTEDMLLGIRQSTGDGLLNDGTSFTGYPVVGFNHHIQAAGGCEEEMVPQITATGIDFDRTGHGSEEINNSDGILKFSLSDKLMRTCFWNPLVNNSILFFDVSISIPTSKVKDAILDIKMLRDAAPKAMCALGSARGFLIRFLTKSKAFLGEPSDAAVFEFFTFRSKEAYQPRFEEGILEEIEQILVHKHGGKPHWGKNRPLAFNDMSSRTLAMGKFLEVKSRLDPFNLFSNEWTNAMFNLNSSVETLDDHCALEGLCVCREDRHCHPSKGYFCMPGLVYKEARVCRHERRESLS